MDALMVEIDGRRLYTNPGAGSWWLTELEGFHDSPGTRFDENLIPGEDGAFEPGEILLEPRRVVVRGTCEVSSAAWADRVTRPWLASLVKKKDLNFRAFVGGRWLSLRRAKIRGQVKVRDVDDVFTEFEIPIWSADSRKFGPKRTIEMDAAIEPAGGLRFPMVDGAVSFGTSGGVLFPGVFAIHNPGSADLFPERFTVRGPMPRFTITSETSVIEYDAAIPRGKDLVITPYAGGRANIDGADVSHNLVRADWVPVGPLETRGYLFAPDEPGPGSSISIDYPEGAWL
jgi:hypothetical protein